MKNQPPTNSSHTETSTAGLQVGTEQNADTQDTSLLAASFSGDVGQLYTPAMLAEILGLSVRVIRRWHRAGLLQATTAVLQLPYFDFSQLATARRLTRWMAQGATVQSIQQQLQLLRQRAEQHGAASELPAELLTIESLPITAEGKRLILRSGDQYVEASGQFRFGFEATEPGDPQLSAPAVVPFQRTAGFGLGSDRPSAPSSTLPAAGASEILSLQAMVDQALAAEDVDDLLTAIDWYRAAMAAYGANANLCFQLAELLYRGGDLSGARERYFVALELDASLVEARANLGCVLAECGQPELAVAAFEGTLEQYADYADVHFHLARALDDLGQSSRAIEHWQQFLQLAPASPWAEEATERLRQLAPLLDF